MKTRLLKRLNVIAVGGASRILFSLSNVIVSFVVIRTQSPDLWGGFVIYLLTLELGFSIVSWGSTPYLIHEFSLQPSKIQFFWSRSFVSRSVLLGIFLMVILFLPERPNIIGWLMLWAVARFFYQSFETFVQYDRHFLFSFVTEMIGLSIVIVPISLSQGILNAEQLIILFSLSTVGKAFISILFFRKKISFTFPSRMFFIEAFPFLLLTFSGMAQQRSDLYCVAYFLPKLDVARYQVFINLLIFSQFLASLLLSPFAKNIFRLDHSTFLKLERQFVLAGIFLSGLSVCGLYIFTHFFYKLEFSLPLFVLGYFYVLMFYIYLLRNYLLGKKNKQLLAAMYSFGASGINIGLSIILTPRFGLEGALTASLLAQVLLVVLYHQKIIFAHATC